jgi:hypothetical protein
VTVTSSGGFALKKVFYTGRSTALQPRLELRRRIVPYRDRLESAIPTTGTRVCPDSRWRFSTISRPHVTPPAGNGR